MHTPDDYNVAMSTGSHTAAQAFEAQVERIDAALPQTQCQRCGYPACRPYAEAIARGEAAINRCPPGGEEGVRALARITGQPVQPLDPEYGTQTPPRVALIDEDVCIGCTKCIQACPVDAIVGASKLMHTVIAERCTGCELCLPPCPVDCIAMVADPGTPPRLPRPALPCPP
jgi:electron transport complex protein RnfB